MEIKHDDWIQTYTGKKFYLLNTTPDMFCLEDVAHALSMTCRFSGHIKRFYSVAEHSVYVSVLCSTKEDKLAALFHDASEAYLTDVASPFKSLLINYKELEHNLMGVASQKFGFKYPYSNEVKQADVAQLKIEAVELLTDYPQWVDDERYKTPLFKSGITPWGFSPKKAKEMFLKRYSQIINDKDEIDE